jgi:hypothetical protein
LYGVNEAVTAGTDGGDVAVVKVSDAGFSPDVKDEPSDLAD